MPALQVPPPGLFQIEITNLCNIDCAMCARSAGLKRPIGHMDIELFKTIVDQSAFYEMPIHWFHHFGETLIYPHLREALGYFKEHGFGPGRVSTNAILLTPERADILLEHASYVLCCLDSMDPVAYRNIRNNIHFEKVKKNIAHFIAERDRRGSDVKIVVQFLRTQHNQDEDIATMMEYFGRHDNLKFIEKRTDKHPKGGDISLGGIANPEENKRNCFKIQREFCVLWDGGCVPCCWDADGDQIIGTVPDQDIGQIWQGHRHREMQRQLAAGTAGNLPLCDKCAGPISDTLFGVAEQVNAWVQEWNDQKARVVVAPAGPAMYNLLDNTGLRHANIIAMSDRQPDGKKSHLGVPVVPYEAIPDLNPDVMFIFSPGYSSEIYFQQQHLRERGIKLVTLGGYLD